MTHAGEAEADEADEDDLRPRMGVEADDLGRGFGLMPFILS